MFSRFDNMMQHTHTHTRPKKKDSCDSSEGKLSPMSVPEDHSMMHVPSLPSPTTSTIMMENHHHLLNDEEKFTSYYQQQQQQQEPTSPTSEKDFTKYKQQLFGYSQQQHFSSSESTCSSSQQNQRQWSPMYYNTPSSPTPTHNSNTMTVPPPTHPPLKFYSSVSHTDYFQQPQPQHQHQHQHQHQPRKNSMHSETTTTMLKRHLSYVDLSTPIQELGHSYSTSSNSSDTTSNEEADEAEEARDNEMPSYLQSRFKANGIDITVDEFEALQGFGKFCMEPVVREPILMTRITTSPTCSISFPIKLPPLRNVSPTAVISNNITSQINAFRQQISTTHESFSRNRT